MAWGRSPRPEARGPEDGAVPGQRLVDRSRAEVVGEGEGEAQQSGELGAEGGGAEEPHLREVPASGDRRRGWGRPLRGHEVGEEFDHVLGEALCPRSGAPQGLRRHRVGARGPPETEVDASGMEGLERGELFGHDHRRVVGEHHPAGSHPQCGGGVGQMGHEDGRCRAGHRGHPVVLGHPEAPVPESLDERGEPHRVVEGVGDRGPFGHGGEIEDGQVGHGRSNVGEPRGLPPVGPVQSAAATSCSMRSRVRAMLRRVFSGRPPRRSTARWRFPERSQLSRTRVPPSADTSS